MTAQRIQHSWIRAATSRARRATAETLRTDSLWLGAFDCHARLAGPYGGTSSMLEALLPHLTDAAAHVARYRHTLLTVVPDLARFLGPVPASDEEQIRFASSLQVTRLAHGVAEFLQGCPGRYAAFLDNAHAADPTTQELIAVLLGRLDPATFQLHIGSPQDGLPFGIPPEMVVLEEGAEVAVTGAAEELARRFVDGDGVDDDAEVLAAYAAIPPEQRARWHDARADELEREGRRTAQWGALPYHREHGSDRAAAAEAMRAATVDFLSRGYYHATIAMASRGLALVTAETDYRPWWAFTTSLGTALAALGRTEEALSVYLSARAATVRPKAHMSSAYSIAMLYARSPDAALRDPHAARGWVNTALALADLLPDPLERTVATVFNEQGLAMLDSRAGDHERALQRIDSGLAELDRVLDAAQRTQDRARLWHNRSQVNLALGEPEAALRDMDTVIALDPLHNEHYFDRAAIHRALDQPERALMDYEKAIRLGPPFPELFHNRSDTFLHLGRPSLALPDLDYALTLDPHHVESLLSRATLRYEFDDLDAALEDAERGLALAPANGHLLCTRGLIHTGLGELDAALADFTSAVTAEPDLWVAWANRAEIRLQRGEANSARHDLHRALELVGDTEEADALRERLAQSWGPRARRHVA